MRVVLAASFIILIPATANAQVDVEPRRKSTSVVLEATKEVRPSAREQVAKPISTPGVQPKYLRCSIASGGSSCGDTFAALPGQPGDDGPELTPGDVLRAVQEIGLPSLLVKVEPGDATLVNVPTNFYAEPQPFERSVTLLGFDVDVVASPTAFQWIHGDGTTRTTTQPGRAYPALDVTHQYTQPADTLRTRVDVTYQVRFRVDGGAWQTIGQTLLATGPEAVLAVSEAAPVLTKP